MMMNPEMETQTYVDMQDYWNEFKTVKGRIAELRGSNSEEDSRSLDEDSDDTFIMEAMLPERLKEDREITEAELTNSRLYVTLTDRQRAQLIRRTQERNLTLRQKRLKVKNRKPDIWSVFSATDNSSTGTRSRSATPDSLDSISPPRTPPDPSPKDWVDPHLSRSRASLDSGHHSLILSPSTSLSPVSPPSASPQHLDLPPTGFASNAKCVRPDVLQRERDHSPLTRNEFYYRCEDGSKVHSRIYRPSSLDMLASDKGTRGRHEGERGPDAGRANKEATVRRQRSYAKDVSKDVRQYYNTNKGHYDINPRFLYDPEAEEIQGLHYKQIGSLHIPHCHARDRRNPFVHSDAHQQDPDSVAVPSAGVRRTHSIKHPPRDPFDFQDKSGEPGQPPQALPSVPLVNVEGKSTADLGFRVVCNGDAHEQFPDIVAEVGRSGETKVDWLHEADLERLRTLALLELDILFTEHNIHHRWAKRNKKPRLKEAENGVFGCSLETLSEKDNAFISESAFCESSTPQVLHKLMGQLELRGLRDEGILRIPGHRAKTEELRRVIDASFYEDPWRAEAALRGAFPNEVASLLKLFLRELPQPLLTHALSSAFYKTHRIESLGERILALSMLVILLPKVHRDTLKSVLELCAKIVAHEADNKMGLYNVAMIVAPNIFLPSLQPKSKLPERDQINSQMEYARITTQLVQALIKYRRVVWAVPTRLVAQIRHQIEASQKQSSSKSSIQKLLSRRPKDLIHRPIANEVDYQNGVLRITAPQFSKMNYPIKLDWTVTARDILYRFIDEETFAIEGPHRVAGRREQKLLAPSSVPAAGGGSSLGPFLTSHKSHPLTTCLLRGSINHALDNHALHETGGNITEKRIDHNAFLIAVYQDNPNGEFFVRCHHPGGQMDSRRHVSLVP